uniref:Uncharacterized protein n=1 Tax=Vitis vinifera TaxID=29760 RepID=A5CA90_VITVI|nr:hypothetical protein VITISV_012341 [Vitis vinifera]
MAKTRGSKTPSPSSHNREPRVSPVQDSMIEPSQPLAVPPSVEGVPPSPPLRRYETRRPPTTPGASSSRPKKSASHPPKKKARISASVEPSEPSSEPQPTTTESQIPSRMTPEVIIRRPMVTQPPIEGNLDCQARPFHSELCFDRETFRLQPELKDSFHLLQRYHLEHLMTPRDFFYPRVALDFYQSMTTHRVRDSTIIHFTIDGRHEKVHRKKLLRADAISLLFPRLLCQILEHLGYPYEPQLERKRICREIFTLNKWTSMTAYDAQPGDPAGPEHPEIPQPEHPEEP